MKHLLTALLILLSASNAFGSAFGPTITIPENSSMIATFKDNRSGIWERHTITLWEGDGKFYMKETYKDGSHMVKEISQTWTNPYEGTRYDYENDEGAFYILDTVGNLEFWLPELYHRYDKGIRPF